MLQSIITQFLNSFSAVTIPVIGGLGLAIIFDIAGVIDMAYSELDGSIKRTARKGSNHTGGLG